MQRIALEVTNLDTGITTIEGATVIESAEQLDALFAGFDLETDDSPLPAHADFSQPFDGLTEAEYWDEMAADHGIEEYDDFV